MISMEDIWTANPSWELLPITRKLKKDLSTRTLLDEEAIDLLFHCPSNQESHVYVNGMSGELSPLKITELLLTILAEDPFDTAQNFTSSSFLNSLSHPCTNIFNYLAENILPDICSHHITANSPDVQSSEILKQVAENYSGIVTPWTYWGGAGTPFPGHQEDGDLNSANFHIAGYPKVWTFKNASQTMALQKHFEG